MQIDALRTRVSLRPRRHRHRRPRPDLRRSVRALPAGRAGGRARRPRWTRPARWLRGRRRRDNLFFGHCRSALPLPPDAVRRGAQRTRGMQVSERDNESRDNYLPNAAEFLENDACCKVLACNWYEKGELDNADAATRLHIPE